METKAKYIKVDLFAVAPGVWGMKDVFVNVYAILNPAENNWFLVDAGLKWSAPKIKRMAELLFGAGSKPAAIILTHGHFDHVGSVATLARDWDVQVYAHHLEMPYLTGISSYPPADPTVGGGLMADVSFLYPKTPINIEDRVISLPQGGLIPGLPEWKYIHTPGHAPGHISLFREADKVLISGDAIVTTKQESALSVMLQLRKLSGPPKYFTSDWLSAAISVELLAKLEPEVVASGHGRPIRGAGLRKSLHMLVKDFEKVAVPAQGRYVHQPALSDDTGVVHLPPKNRNANASPTLKLLGIAAAALIAMMLLGDDKKKKKRKKLELAKADEKKAQRERQLENIRSKGKKHLNEAGETAREEFRDLKKKGNKEFKNMKGDAKEGMQDYKDAGKKEISELKDAGRKEAKRLSTSAGNFVDDTRDAGKKAAQRLSNSADDWFTDRRDAGKKEAKRLSSSAGEMVDDTRDAAKKGAKRLSSSAGEMVDDTRDAAKKEAKQLRKSADDWFTDRRDAGKKEAKRLSTSAGDMVEDSSDAVKKAAKKLGNSVERAYDNTRDAGRRELKQVKKAGRQKSDNLRESILDAIGHLKFPVRKGIKKIKRFGS